MVLNGPNLNLLGTREPELYGRDTLADIEAACATAAQVAGLEIDFRQTNHEGEMVDWIQAACGPAARGLAVHRTAAQRTVAGLVINAAAWSHTSVALLDALRIVDLPVIEVHLSNIFRREPYRHHSHISQAAKGVICGLGGHGYVLAIEALAGLLKRET